ncbi:hypothetical protein SAMN05519104_7797 [Rhizobiales bacterium GAS188]|nr:hypothetical protein SAMN05519104_7797 [Rhizobiales bacterium GAS188]
MTTVEVLAPLRLETRFVPPAERPDGGDQWTLRLRIYPDEFSIRRVFAPPTPAELDRLTEAVSRMSAAPALSEADAFASFAAAVGASRALGLWRAHVVPGAGGVASVDRAGEAEHVPFAVHGPAGLPARLEVWLVHADGVRQLATTLAPDVAAIGKDLDVLQFNDMPRLSAGVLPQTWWLSYPRAVEVGLGVDLDIGATPPTLEALVVLGIGDRDAAELVDAHNATGRLAVLAPGTPTNTVAGEPTTDFGDHAQSIFPLLHIDPATQLSTSALLKGLSGRTPPSALPMLGGDLDYFGPGSLAVQGLWPVLWGRSLRDVTGAGGREIDLARWAMRNLAVEGPRPAFRVGEQPYGLVPTSAFGSWIDEAGDPMAAIEARIRRWTLKWRAGAAAEARAKRGRVVGEDIRGMLDVLGLHAPSRHWNVRAVADRYGLQALRALAGMRPLDTTWDDTTALALRNVAAPLAPVGRAPGLGSVPGPPSDQMEDVEQLRRMCVMDPEPLFGSQAKLGLVGHLFREALIDGRAVIGDAVNRLRAGTPISLDQNLPWDDEPAYLAALFQGSDAAVAELRAGADPNGRVLGARFREVQEALEVFADLWASMSGQLFRAVLAALDTAAFRVDPWLTGIAERRLQGMIAGGAPFRLGAYGWVDAPAPYAGGPGGPLAPGPTRAGLLHAPSPAQALTAALLRDAAVRYPGSDRWNLAIDSAKVRATVALAERVRLGLHPYEALGLEVEKAAGDWDTVRMLRKSYPLAADQQERRVCDGQKVLQAARQGTLPADLAQRLAPLDTVLDTYGDLLLADGAYALVTGHADLANAAMEAAAGLGAPPELRAIRTPRQATTVRVSAWALLLPGNASAGRDADPARAADPAYAAALDAELGAGAIDAADTPGRERRDRFGAILGGGENEPPIPSLTGGAYEGLDSLADANLRRAMAQDLGDRLARVASLAQAALDDLAALDPNTAGSELTIKAAAARWAIDLAVVPPADPGDMAPTAAELLAYGLAALADRLSTAASMVPAGGGGPAPPDTFINAVRRAIRVVAGRPDLPVLPIVARALLPTLRPSPDLDAQWLEIVAAVRPRLASLDAHQLDAALPNWPGAVAAPDASIDPWHASGPVVAAYGPGVDDNGPNVAIAALDGWTDSVPSRRHATTAAFGFNAPKSRAPQAVLAAVPPDPSRRLDNAGLLEVVLETRELAHARAPRQIAEPTLAYATSTALVSASPPRNFLDGWPP